MRKNNGFTLVEILAVISILGVVSILMIPTLMNAFTNSKKVLRGYTEEGLIDAGKMYVTDLDQGVLKYTYNQDTPTTVNGNEYKKGDNISGYDLKTYLIESGGILVNIEELIKGGYYDADCKYAGTKVEYVENGVTKEKVFTEDNNCTLPKTCMLKVGIEGKRVQNDKYYVSNGYTAEIYGGCEVEKK